MALNSTIYTFTVRLADSDRSVYDTLALKVAQHPSESPEYLITRVLAYCLEYTEGISFSKGLSDPDEPAISIRDLTGVLHTWIDVGLPEAARLHKAGKLARRVVVYAHRDVTAWLGRLADQRIHRADSVEIRVIDRELVMALVSRLERRMELDLAISDGDLYVSLGEATFSGALAAQRLTA